MCVLKRCILGISVGVLTCMSVAVARGQDLPLHTEPARQMGSDQHSEPLPQTSSDQHSEPAPQTDSDQYANGERPATLSEFGTNRESSYDFLPGDLPAAIEKTSAKSKKFANALNQWREEKFESALRECHLCAHKLKHSKQLLGKLAERAEYAVRTHSRAKAIVLYMVAYELWRRSNDQSKIDPVPWLLTVGNICNDNDSKPAESFLAERCYEDAFTLSAKRGGLQINEAPSVYRCAQMHLANNQWESAERVLKLWLELFQTKNVSPPPVENVEVLTELGRSCNNQNKYEKSEKYYTQALAACRKYSGGTITAVNHYDVASLLICTLIDEHKFSAALDMAKQEFTAKGSGQRNEALDAIAKKFEDNNQVDLAAQVRSLK
jgi:tetratricopeptide (TPR) repeat protein